MYPVELSERLGHTSVSVTMNVYAHLIPTSDRRHLRPHLQPRIRSTQLVDEPIDRAQALDVDGNVDRSRLETVTGVDEE